MFKHSATHTSLFISISSQPRGSPQEHGRADDYYLCACVCVCAYTPEAPFVKKRTCGSSLSSPLSSSCSVGGSSLQRNAAQTGQKPEGEKKRKSRSDIKGTAKTPSNRVRLRGTLASGAVVWSERSNCAL